MDTELPFKHVRALDPSDDADYRSGLPKIVSKRYLLKRAISQAEMDGIKVHDNVAHRPRMPLWITHDIDARNDTWSTWKSFSFSGRFFDQGMLVKVVKKERWGRILFRDHLGFTFKWHWGQESSPDKRGGNLEDRYTNMLEGYFDSLYNMVDVLRLRGLMGDDSWYMVRYYGVRKHSIHSRKFSTKMIKWIRNLDLEGMKKIGKEKLLEFAAVALQRAIACGHNPAVATRKVMEEDLPSWERKIDRLFLSHDRIMDTMMPTMVLSQFPKWVHYWGADTSDRWVKRVPEIVARKNIRSIPGYLSSCAYAFKKDKWTNGDVGVIGYMGMFKMYELLDSMGAKGLEWMKDFVQYPLNYPFITLLRNYRDEDEGPGHDFLGKLLSLLSYDKSFPSDGAMWEGPYLDLIDKITEDLPERFRKSLECPASERPWGTANLWMDDVGRAEISSWRKKPKSTWKKQEAKDFEIQVLEGDLPVRGGED